MDYYLSVGAPREGKFAPTPISILMRVAWKMLFAMLGMNYATFL